MVKTNFMVYTKNKSHFLAVCPTKADVDMYFDWIGFLII